MRFFCHYCPGVIATHTCVVVDVENSGLHHDVRHKRVPICLAHALQLRRDGERRVEVIPEQQENERWEHWPSEATTDREETQDESR